MTIPLIMAYMIVRLCLTQTRRHYCGSTKVGSSWCRPNWKRHSTGGALSI